MHKAPILRQVGSLHADNLDQGFLATLGPRFLALMYQAIDESDSSVLLVEERDGRAVGFVSGAQSMTPIYRQMLRHWPALIATLFPSLLNPCRVWRIIEILRYGGVGAALPKLPEYELLSIAVDPSVRGHGVSEQLYRGLVDYCLAHCIPAFKIVVGQELLVAHRFYRRMGAQVVGEIEVHRGEKSLVYVQDVQQQAV